MTAYVQALSGSPLHAHNHHRFPSPIMPVATSSHSQVQAHAQTREHSQPARRHASKHRFFAELSHCLFEFVIQLLPTPEELAVKEDVRKLLERLIRTIEPESRLLSFGSMANGFALKNSDMDLCCLIDSGERLAAADLVNMLGNLLERETKFAVKPLPYARIPIVKLSLDPSPGLPFGIACDIGFENRLALENTRLLMSYAMIDPARVRTIVLFLKVWSKRRKVNSPYKGTLSSYGYVLLVIYFLTHVKNPPVLPNLQQIPPLRSMSPEEMRLGDKNIWFFDDIELLRQRWQSANTETVAELLADFFKYYSRDFSYNTAVVSIRAGAIQKDAKGWQGTLERGKYSDPRERNRFCIEDPFETEFNVARCVSKDGLYAIRGEFMRASRIFQSRPERPILALAQLCEERIEDDPAPSAPLGGVTYIATRLTPLPPQTPYTVGSSSMRPQIVPAPVPQKPLSPPSPSHERIPDHPPPPVPKSPPPPDHMGPTRSKWTSPPPADALPADFRSFEDRLGAGLVQATAPTDAREAERSYASSASNSEVFTDDGRVSDVADLDDVRSVRSFTDEPSSHQRWSPQQPPHRAPPAGYATSPGGSPDNPSLSYGGPRNRPPGGLRLAIQSRGRVVGKLASDKLVPPGDEVDTEGWLSGHSRRSISGPPRALGRYSLPSSPVAGPNRGDSRPAFTFPSPARRTSTVFYETSAGPKERATRTENVSASGSGTPAAGYRAPAPPYITVIPPWQQRYPHHLMDPRTFSPSGLSLSAMPRTSLEHASPQPFTGVPTSEHSAVGADELSRPASGGLQTPTPTSGAPDSCPPRRVSHAHTHSAATIIAPVQLNTSPPTHGRPHRPRSPSRSPSASTSIPAPPESGSVPLEFTHTEHAEKELPRHPPHYSPGTDSPAPSSLGSSRYTSPASTSPPSPTQDQGVSRPTKPGGPSSRAHENSMVNPIKGDFVEAVKDMSLNER